MSLSTAIVASAAMEEGQAVPAKPARQTPALWLPRVDSLAEFGLMISRQLTQCRRYGGHLSVLWLEAAPADAEDDATLAPPASGEPPAADEGEAGAERVAALEARSQLMTAVGRRLRSRVRGTDMVLQVGETSFAVLLLDAGLREAHLVQQRLAPALNSPYGVDTRLLQVRLQMGTASFPEGGLRGADLAESARQDLRRRRC
ncbi:diguanylate cyclase domain-containing protein [Roseateles sp. 22389]|uniref:diguanylate cyclase domain-containing protein n=1 Tax=Roseateles sp. 22389 TaxID=3453916 RepID=UPI003F8296F0